MILLAKQLVSIFIFLICFEIVLGYKPGDLINLSYTNITNVTEPCILSAGKVYLSASAAVGDITCNVTYWDYEQQTVSSGSGGGGSSRRKIYNTLVVNNSKPNITAKVLPIYIKRPKQTTIANESIETAPVIYEQNISNYIDNTTEPKPTSAIFMILAVVIIAILMSGAFYITYYYLNKED